MGRREEAATYPCRVCEGSGPGVFVKRGYVIAECARCGTRFVPSGIAPPMRYDEGYFTGEAAGGGYGSYLADRQRVFANFERRVEWFAPHATGRRLLDVGAAYGLLVHVARRFGFDAIGIEPVAACAVVAKRELEVEVITGTIETVDLAPASFDVVTMFDVVEHLEEPRVALRRVRSLLRPGGLLVIETGDRDGLLARSSGRRWYFYDPPQHVTFFGRRGLEGLLGELGFSAPITRAALGRDVSLRNFGHQLGRSFGDGPAGRLCRRVAQSRLGELSFRVPDRGNAFALGVRRLGDEHGR